MGISLTNGIRQDTKKTTPISRDSKSNSEEEEKEKPTTTKEKDSPPKEKINTTPLNGDLLSEEPTKDSSAKLSAQPSVETESKLPPILSNLKNGTYRWTYQLCFRLCYWT